MTETIDAPRTLLLAASNPTTQRVVVLAFAGEPVSVAIAGDGDEVLRFLDDHVPDIVVADLTLAGSSGYDVAEYVRRRDRLAHVPVLLLAGAFESVDRERAAAAGTAGVIVKPFDPQALVERVRLVLAQPPAGTPAERAADLTAVPITDARVVIDTEVSDGRPPTEPRPVDGPAGPEPIALEAGTDDAEPPPRSPDLDRYFDQLDEAFAALVRTARPEQPPPHVAPETGAETVAETGADAAPGADVLSTPASPGAVARGIRQPVEGLGQAFAVLLHAEETGTPPASLLADGDELETGVSGGLDPLTRRALAEMTERVLRETVSEIVSSTAERLVREEIERIKRHIK